METKDVRIEVIRRTSWADALFLARWTARKESVGREPSDAWKARMCLAEHSPIREVRFLVLIRATKDWISQHLSRHDAFAGHTVREGAMGQHFVTTSREDRTGTDRETMLREKGVDHAISLSAADFITISRRRLCFKSHPETVRLWRMVLDALAEVDPVLASKCVGECVYRNGYCPEMESCGYWETEACAEDVRRYHAIHGFSTDETRDYADKGEIHG